MKIKTNERTDIIIRSVITSHLSSIASSFMVNHKIMVKITFELKKNIYIYKTI